MKATQELLLISNLFSNEAGVMLIYKHGESTYFLYIQGDMDIPERKIEKSGCS